MASIDIVTHFLPSRLVPEPSSFAPLSLSRAARHKVRGTVLEAAAIAEESRGSNFGRAPADSFIPLPGGSLRKPHARKMMTENQGFEVGRPHALDKMSVRSDSMT